VCRFGHSMSIGGGKIWNNEVNTSLVFKEGGSSSPLTE
jgi:hypothetical protein